jgi:hypothetical protein
VVLAQLLELFEVCGDAQHSRHVTLGTGGWFDTLASVRINGVTSCEQISCMDSSLT